MKELINLAGSYAGEFIVGAIALLIRSIEKKIVIRKNRKKWEQGEQFTKVEKK